MVPIVFLTCIMAVDTSMCFRNSRVHFHVCRVFHIDARQVMARNPIGFWFRGMS